MERANVPTHGGSGRFWTVAGEAGECKIGKRNDLQSADAFRYHRAG